MEPVDGLKWRRLDNWSHGLERRERVVTPKDPVLGGHRGVPEDGALVRSWRVVVRKRDARNTTHAQDSMELAKNVRSVLPLDVLERVLG